MSWEEVGITTVPCLCGKGYISRTDYMDDWNRYESKYSIECPECSKKYHIITRRSYRKHDGELGEDQYLLENEYPDYVGTSLLDVFPGIVDVFQMPFDEYLIRTYTSDDLKDALAELNTVKAVSRLTGCAASIAYRHKRSFHSAKISVLKAYVERACKKYNEIADNKENRLPIEQKEREERAAYEEEMLKHLIHVPL